MTAADRWATDAEITDSPQEGARLLADLLDRAARHGRSAILFAVYRAESTRALAEQLLLQELRERNLRARRVRLPLEDKHSGPEDLPLWLRWHPPADDEAVFVYDLARAFPGVLNALNYRRELFVEGRWKVLFWLRDEELGQVGRRAPDFWAFRNQVVELLDVPPLDLAAWLSQEIGLAWIGFEERVPPEELEARIGSRERLLAELGDAAETAAVRAELVYTLGGLYHWKKDHARALELLEQALALARQLEDRRLEAWIHNGLGNVYRDLGRHDEAIAAYQRALELGGLTPQQETIVHSNLGKSYHDLRRYDEAIAVYQRAIELAPNDAASHNGLGDVCSDLGRYDEAIAAYQRAVELDPTYASPHNGLGNVYRDLGRHDETVAAYQRVVELDPTEAYPHNNLGNIYRDLGRHDEAIAAYQRAIELDPDYVYPHNNLGLVYHDLGRHDEAIAEYQCALELGGLTPQQETIVHSNLGKSYRDLGRYDEAIAAYQRAVELDPTDAYPHNGLGNVYGDLGRHDEAIAEYRRAIKLDPTDADYHSNLGLVYHDLGRHDETIAAYERAIELDPTFATAHVSLASVYRHLGQTDAWAHHIAEARRLVKPDDTYNLACLESVAGNVDAALEHLAQALAQAPGDRTWAARAPDLAWVRDDPRFQALVGGEEDSDRPNLKCTQPRQGFPKVSSK